MKRLFSFLSFAESLLKILFWVCLFFGFDTPAIAVMTALCALIHEDGHLFVMHRLGVTPALPRAGWHGLLLPIGKTVSYKTDILISAAGAAANVLCFVLCLVCPAPADVRDYLSLFGRVSLYTGLCNLLPAEGYDGERILYAVLCLRASPDIAAKVCEWTSFSTAVLFCFLALFRLLAVGSGYWMFFVFFSSLLGKITRAENG